MLPFLSVKSNDPDKLTSFAKEVSLSGSLDLTDKNGNIIGELRSACYSPHFEKVIGIAMMKKPYWDVSQEVRADMNKNICTGKVCDLPFI